MSQENVERFRRGVEAYNRGDFDAMFAMMHPDFEYVTAGLFPGLRPVYRGQEGYRQLWRDFREIWDSFQVEVNEVHDAGEHIVALLTFRARSREGLEVDRRFGCVVSVKDGLAVRQRVYADWNEALEAVGLRE